jgi:hypothetical protein
MRRTTRASAALLALLPLLWLGCAGLSVNADWDPQARFDDLHSWAWLPGQVDGREERRPESPLVRRRIVAAVEDGFAARGYTQIQQGTPDFWVAYHVAIENKLETRTIYDGYRPGPYWYGYGWPYAETYTEEYQVGTLLIDVIDGRSRQLMWRGIAQARLRELHTPQEREQQVRKAVQAILERFPPPAR